MHHRSIAAAISLCCAFGSADALTMRGTGWTAQLTGFESYPIEVVTIGQPWSEEIAAFSFEVQDGFHIPELQFDLTYSSRPQGALHFLLSSSFATFGGLEPGGITFSNSSSSGGFGPVPNGTVIPLNGVHLTGTDLFFNGGKGLNPSSDSSCSSFACMTPFTEKARYVFTLSVYTIPEPSSLALCAAGLAVAGAIVRTRRAGA
jgi:hypothetical protein